MIKLENYEVLGWEHAIRGMRNPMNSWSKSDSEECEYKLSFCSTCINLDKCRERGTFDLGPNDHDLMMKLRNAGTDHRKYMRMITVYVDITAPLYWWKEFDTYKVGTVANSCSTMHKIHDKEFTLEDFSTEHLMVWSDFEDQAKELKPDVICNFKFYMMDTIHALNNARDFYLKTNDKRYWWQMIQLLPSSYNQKRTVMLNYEVLANIYKSRKNHKLDEWRELCKWIESLPYSEIITGGGETDDNKWVSERSFEN
jgi:glycosyltransferase involved in cell wall biosynthesis